MPGFADSFWSGDYAGGLGVLFGKLQQGVIENQQVLTIARMRAEAEDMYGARLGDIAPTTDKMVGGFARDDGASVRKAYEGVRGEMQEASKNHIKIASNIRELVVTPFSRWCDAHEARVQNSQDDLQARIKAHDKQAEVVRKLRSHYFNKCRQVEDLEEENKLAFQDPEKAESASPKITPTPTIKVSDPVDLEEAEPLDIGDQAYPPDAVKKILTQMLNTIKLGEAKVPIIGTYQNVSTGADIVDYLQKYMGASSVSYAERIGQDLVTHGFLRLVGNVGNTFANSSKMNYQWRPKVFQITGIPEKKQSLGRVTSIGSATGTIDSPTVGNMGEMLSAWNPLNNPHPNETPIEKLRRESHEADEKYKAGVRRLDLLRCNLEEAMIDHFKFMERCELDRLKAIKAVILDFSGAISNVIPSLQSTVDNMMLYQETVQPMGDLRYLLENYRTGAFVPRVQIYDNYYNTVDEQTFGVDLEARARADRKRVPVIITTILMFLDNHYPDLEGDEARRGIWLVDVPLGATHHLRNTINTGKAIPREVLERYEIPIVASVLKLYLLELPDSLVSSQTYEIIKTIYLTPDSSTSPQTRISVLQNTLGQLRLANIATLDAITTHFTRLIELTSADEPFIASLAQAIAPCILRPRTESALSMHERHSYRLVRDLFDHKEEIFGELKRANTLTHTLSGGSGRPRAISTDESNRRANTEARNRAIVSKSRASSPAPPHAASTANGRAGNRRDRSTGPAETRFPIQTSPTMVADSHKRVPLLRQSLEVPGSQDALPAAEKTADTNSTSSTHPHLTALPEKPLPSAPAANGTSDPPHPGPNPVPDGHRGRYAAGETQF
ncbi:rho-gtpase-activating protein [Lasallia pustulata]|uniref:Rho-gtpase-activating protein n=1 Tax=Lasallia pustulata TaxID=136370 RepID=A0A1W5CRN3_9LECA|nr:rho-gtpase-activating protein [Lasallia pustulata]